jgi:hypothetical protein
MKEKRFIKRIFALSVSLFFVTSCKAEYGWLNLSEKTSSSATSVPQIVIHTCTFNNYDGQTLEIDKVVDGGSVRFLGETPTRASDSANTYKFTGWDKSLDNIANDTIFTATFASTTRLYKCTFYADEAKTEVYTYFNAHYGDNIGNNAPTELTKAGDGQSYFYRFEGWDPDPNYYTVKGDTDYAPIFTKHAYDSSQYIFSVKTDSDGLPASYKATGYAGIGETVSFPDVHKNETFGNLPVDEVGPLGNAGFLKAKNIWLSDNVVTIDDDFLAPQGGVNSIVNRVFISDKTKTIGANAFKGTSSVYAISSGSYSDISNCFFPATLSAIGANAFQGSGIYHVYLNRTQVTTIPSYAFEGCPHLLLVSLPTYFENIESYAFANSSLQSLVLPYPSEMTILRTFADNAFENCTSLKDVFFGGTKATDETFEKGLVSTTGNEALLNASWHLYSENKPTSTSGSYWHYDKSGYPVVW